VTLDIFVPVALLTPEIVLQYKIIGGAPGTPFQLMVTCPSPAIALTAAGIDGSWPAIIPTRLDSLLSPQLFTEVTT